MRRQSWRDVGTSSPFTIALSVVRDGPSGGERTAVLSEDAYAGPDVLEQAGIDCGGYLLHFGHYLNANHLH